MCVEKNVYAPNECLQNLHILKRFISDDLSELKKNKKMEDDFVFWLLIKFISVLEAKFVQDDGLFYNLMINDFRKCNL